MNRITHTSVHSTPIGSLKNSNTLNKTGDNIVAKSISPSYPSPSDEKKLYDRIDYDISWLQANQSHDPSFPSDVAIQYLQASRGGLKRAISAGGTRLEMLFPIIKSNVEAVESMAGIPSQPTINTPSSFMRINLQRARDLI